MKFNRAVTTALALLLAGPAFAHGGLTDAPAWLVQAHEIAHAAAAIPPLMAVLAAGALGILGWRLRQRYRNRQPEARR